MKNNKDSSLDGLPQSGLLVGLCCTCGDAEIVTKQKSSLLAQLVGFNFEIVYGFSSLKGFRFLFFLYVGI